MAVGLILVQGTVAAGAGGTYTCRPDLPFFCGNIHVGCAGRTTIPATAFRVSVAGDVATVTFADAGGPIRGRIAGSEDLVIRLEDSPAWIRIQPDRRYSHRIYRRGGAAMSRGTCIAIAAER